MARRKLIGYDLDGVIAPKRENWFLNLLWNIYPLLATRIAHRNLPAPIRIPEPNAVIITGRCSANFVDTYRWLNKHGIWNEVFLNVNNYTPDKKESMKWKAKNINRLKVTHFYEDDLETVEYIKKHTTAKVFHIK